MLIFQYVAPGKKKTTNPTVDLHLGDKTNTDV